MSKVIGWSVVVLMFTAFAVKYSTGISVAVWAHILLGGK